MWTDAAIETLRQMALEGKSASTIAVALGAPSRNAVIGKANRIGVKLTGKIHCSAPRPPRSVTERPRDRRSRAGARHGSAPLSRHPARAEAGMGFRRGPGGEMLKIGLEEISEERADGRLATRQARNSPIAASRPRRAAPIAPDIAGWPTSRRIRGSGTASVTWPSSRWPPEAATGGCISPRRMGARARASREAFRAGAIFMCPAFAVSRRTGPFRLGRVGPDAFGEFQHVERIPRSRPLGTAMVGGAIAMAILDLLVRKNILTVDDVQGCPHDRPKLAHQFPRSPGLAGRRQNHRRDQRRVRAARARPLDRAPRISASDPPPRRYRRSAPCPASA